MEFNFNKFCENMLFREHTVLKKKNKERKKKKFLIFDILFVYIYIELRI